MACHILELIRSSYVEARGERGGVGNGLVGRRSCSFRVGGLQISLGELRMEFKILVSRRRRLRFPHSQHPIPDSTQSPPWRECHWVYVVRICFEDSMPDPMPDIDNIFPGFCASLVTKLREIRCHVRNAWNHPRENHNKSGSILWCR